MIIGLALALASALGTNVAFLLKHRGAVAAPPVRPRHPLRSAAGLFRTRAFLLGWIVAAFAWALHVGALSLAPLSVVQAVLSGGLVFLAVLADRYFGFRVGRRQWIGVLVTGIGLSIIGVTAHSPNHPEHASLAGLIAVEAGVFAIGAALVTLALAHGGRLLRIEGMLLGAAAGALFGVSDIAIKDLSPTVGHDPLALLSPWTGAALVAAVIAFYASARGLQLGPGVEVIALTSIAANLSAILGGIIVFAEPVGHGPIEIGGRVMAFCLVVAGAAFMPAPVRASGHHKTGPQSVAEPG